MTNAPLLEHLSTPELVELKSLLDNRLDDTSVQTWAMVIREVAQRAGVWPISEDEKAGRWVTVRGRPVFVARARGGPGRAGSGPTVRVGITSFKDDQGQGLEQLKKDMAALEDDLDATPAQDVTVSLGTGGFEGGSEPTFVTQFRGNGQARKALAKRAKEWNQDSVIVTTPVKRGGTPEGRLSFNRPLDEAEIRKVNQTVLAASKKVDAGIGGWTWSQGKNGPEFIANCIPGWGGNPETHIQAMRAAMTVLEKAGLGASLSEGRAKVEVWERDSGDYDRIIAGK